MNAKLCLPSSRFSVCSKLYLHGASPVLNRSVSCWGLCCLTFLLDSAPHKCSETKTIAPRTLFSLGFYKDVQELCCATLVWPWLPSSLSLSERRLCQTTIEIWEALTIVLCLLSTLHIWINNEMAVVLCKICFNASMKKCSNILFCRRKVYIYLYNLDLFL